MTKKIFHRIIQPIQDFIRLESSAGLILLGCTIITLILANSPLQQYYTSLWQIELPVGIEGMVLKKTLLHWINDGLMCIFFFVVGLEIKRELLIGELASIKRALLPMGAALGGIILPALIYYLFTAGTNSEAGWGIPMATDIAFSLGVLTLLGSRIPHQLKVLLIAFAIIDDLGAVLVIALFYGSPIQWIFLAAAALVFFILLCANLGGIRHPSVYLILGIVLWLMLLESGIHATIAGVLLALTIPARPRTELSYEEEETLLQRFEHKFHPWVTFAIMPIFALANAGVVIGENFGVNLLTPTALGIICGLVIGKQIGITLFSWISVKAGLAELPSNVTWKHIYGIGLLGGIGFTMSLFIANLAFADEHLLNISKTAVLLASLIAGCIGFFILRFVAAHDPVINTNK
jgi:Na+:H+ antiporter, NhaA family